jgi:hypothetical protein
MRWSISSISGLRLHRPFGIPAVYDAWSIQDKDPLSSWAALVTTKWVLTRAFFRAAQTVALARSISSLVKAGSSETCYLSFLWLLNHMRGNHVYNFKR